jgi:hypothetical protein
MLWRRASISIGDPLGNLEVGSSTRDFERWMKGALGMECFSLKRLSSEGVWGGLLCWGLLEYFVKGQGCYELTSDYGAQRARL